ncbi:4Fe-4S dicluster domain-containing protein [Nannocystis bainbridge]|uniref:4Fe-4S dicluster domain-containing protein n=1 Tax=Nannocystis bainbridge TaxID=2995303 RepID=A0ABT5E6P3_9BACT|nr:4Fe-4S dicluster domain-containing protein [Nannocystis bainbridge]MDC0721519.1 4Fe-4S dicluster domain-containing protein [Nannocystis bainbridge]
MSDELGRRAFLERMAAGLAAAGLGGCLGRDPPERIVPYARQPEYVVPGVPLFFASAFVRDAYAHGVLVETHEGRPTKIEGHPEHRASLGATCPFGQAMVRELYDPRRSTGVRRGPEPSSWPAFLRAARPQLGPGRRLGVLTGPTTSRMLADGLARLAARSPGLRWFAWSPVGRDNLHAGLQRLLGAPLACHARLDRARVVLSLDDDFLFLDPGRLRHARALAQRRRAELASAEALRLYALESFPGLTGAAADHRRAARVHDVPGLARDVLRGVLGDPVDDPWLAAALADLKIAGETGLVLAGPHQPPQVHAMVHATNHVLGAAGRTVVYGQRLERQPFGPAHSLAALVTAIARRELDALLILDENPVYTAPAALGFADALAEVPFTAHLGLYCDETGERCHWHLPLAHPLEAWGDAASDEGEVTLSQPTIRPLYDGLTAPELLAALADDPARGRDLLERTYQDTVPAAADRESWWRAAIHDGRLPAPATPVTTAVASDVLTTFLSEHVPSDISSPDLVLAFRPDPAAWDGRFSLDPWLQELPRPITRLMWGNAAFVAPDTARALGLVHDACVRLRVGDRSVDAPVHVLAGHPPDQLTVHLGYGRRAPVAGVGFDAQQLRGSDDAWSVAVIAEPLARPGGLVVDRHRGGEDQPGDAHARWLLRGEPHPRLPSPALRPESLHPTRPFAEHAWAMTIDLNACIGCNACVIACQAENNIPSVGPVESARDRALHWIRIDTYADDRGDGPRWRFQPVPCMQCEHAPCEVVCPTGATQHSHDGLNDMTYNRCFGTRYCANNCPYKVRRFNFFDYPKRDEATLPLQRNPDVTVRTRGVMEKCTYCVQRIRGAEIAAHREGRSMAAGAVVTACQGACPARAIEFGDLARPDDPVLALRRDPRAYALLAEFGTRPRTTYLARLIDPNPALRPAAPPEED